jgi:hypothetical protein
MIPFPLMSACIIFLATPKNRWARPWASARRSSLVAGKNSLFAYREGKGGARMIGSRAFYSLTHRAELQPQWPEIFYNITLDNLCSCDIKTAAFLLRILKRDPPLGRRRNFTCRTREYSAAFHDQKLWYIPRRDTPQLFFFKFIFCLRPCVF